MSNGSLWLRRESVVEAQVQFLVWQVKKQKEGRLLGRKRALRRGGGSLLTLSLREAKLMLEKTQGSRQLG